jgi:hypothetical protein
MPLSLFLIFIGQQVSTLKLSPPAVISNFKYQKTQGYEVVRILSIYLATSFNVETLPLLATSSTLATTSFNVETLSLCRYKLF